MTERPASGVSRRRLLGAAGVGAAVAGAAGAGVWAGRASAAGATHDHLQLPVPFRGERQAGIITAAQDRMHFATFDVTTDSKADLIAMLMDWTHMAERMTRGEEAAKDGAVGLQLGALGYGVHTVYIARPVFTVFAVDRFELVSEADLEDVFVALTYGDPNAADPTKD